MSVRALGIEEEMFLVDPVTLLPVPRAAQVLGLDDPVPDDAPEDVVGELFQEQLETTTEPALDLDGLRSHVLAARRRASAAAALAGAAILLSPTAPLGDPHVVTRTPRYLRLAERYPDLFPAAAVCGMHVHVDVADADEAVRVADRLAPWLPVVTALSAGSPFSHGVDTGFASWRARQWDRWPTAGPTEPFGDAAGYRRVLADLVRSGVALDERMVYVDARPGRETPTVEVRVADVMVDLDDVVVVAGLLRALVTTLSERPGPAAPRVEQLRAARWLAQRDGLEGRLLDPLTGAAVPAVAAARTVVEHVREALEETGDRELVTAGVRRLLAEGGPARRARTVADGDPARWVRHLLEVSVPDDGEGRVTREPVGTADA